MFSIYLILFVTYLCYKVVKLQRAAARLSNWPGTTNIFYPVHPIGALIDWYIGQKGRSKRLTQARAIYDRVGWNVITSKALFPGASVLVVGDANIVKQITHDHTAFPKPAELYKGLSRFGRNIITTEGDEWRKHRRIAAPAFSEKSNRLVWDTTVTAVLYLVEDIWGPQNIVKIHQFLDITTHMALMVLSAAGFGTPFSWRQDEKPGLGHKLTFTRTLQALAETSLARQARLPRFITKMFKSTELAYESDHEMRIYLSEIVLERQRALDKEDRSDVLTNIIKGGEEGKEGFPALSVSELTGNVFAFLLAGHETTAHALCYVFLLLAVFPEEQDKLYNHIKEVIGDREATYDDHAKLTRVLAVFYEALRLYPIVMGVPKRAAKDAIFNVTRADPNDPTTAQLYIPEGTLIEIDITAIQFNPRHWPNPQDFNPDRFLGDWNRDALVAFSGGLRACIGRRFSETEAVAAISTLLSRYKVSLQDEGLYQALPGETADQRRMRIIQCDTTFFLRPNALPLQFTRR